MSDTEHFVGQIRCACGRGRMDVYLEHDQHDELLNVGVPAVGEAFCCDCYRTQSVKVHLNGCGEFVFALRPAVSSLQLMLF